VNAGWGAAQPGAALTAPQASADGPGRRRSRAWHYVAAFALYEAISLAVWWHLLAAGFGAAIPAGSADPGQEVWFLAWVPHALGAGVNPFFSRSLFAPSGVNLLVNTSMELLGLVLSPITVTAGPVASLDVAVLLAPALSALAAFALCRRYVTWPPAAFVGALCYGFGPFLAGDLRYAHLDLTWLVLPPLIFLCLDTLLVHRSHRSLGTGALLGVLVVAQFFVSTELLAITALVVAAGVAVMCIARPRSVRPSLRAAGPGLALATGIAGAALAYPLWIVAAGPRVVTGPVWRHGGQIAASLASIVVPHAELAGVAFISGSNGSYLGPGLLVVLVAGAVVLWRSAPLRVALALALVGLVLSLGDDLHVGTANTHIALPAALLGHIPLFDSIVPERFGAMVDLFAGLALAIVVDHVRRWQRARSWRAAPVALALAVGAFALVPLATAPHWPYAVTAVRRPAVLDSSLLHPPPGAPAPVLVVYPDSSGAVATEMVWQAESGFTFSLPDGYAIVPGRHGHAVEAPEDDAVWLVFAAATLHRLRLPLSTSTIRAMRADLRAMHARAVVVLPGDTGSAAMWRALSSVFGAPSHPDGVAVFALGRAHRP
jgi:hypothetical protein